MSQDNLIKMQCTVCGQRDTTFKNVKKLRGHRLELNQHCKKCNKHTLYKETK